MANVAVPSIATATPTDADTVLGVQSGAVRRFSVANIRAADDAIAPIGISVDLHAAVGDGTTDDTLAIRAAITAAGVGGTILFTPGKTYLVSGSLTPLEGQTLWGYGAAIKRAAQTSTTTTASITTGSTTSFAVVDASPFFVGQSVALFNGTHNSGNATITTIVGNTITVSSAVTLYSGSPFSGTTTVALSFTTIRAAADGIRVVGLEIDGNRTNWTHHHWETASEVYLGNVSDIVVDGCHIHDGPCEGIQESGGLTESTAKTGRRYTNNVIEQMGGNGIHLSGSGGTLIQGNRITDCTLDASNGHVGGCVTFSWGGRYAQIVDNFFARARRGVGEITNSACDHASICGNTFQDIALTADHVANGLNESFAIEVSGSTKDGLASDITISGNKFIRCSPVIFRTMLISGVTAAQAITGIANGTDTVITCAGHPFVLWAKVLIAGVAGMTEINGVECRVVAVTANTFTVDTDSSTWGTYTSGGTASGMYPKRYVFTGNVMEDCDGLTNTPVTKGAVSVTAYYSGTRGPNGVVIADNIIRMKAVAVPDTNENAIFVGYSDNVLVAGNRIDGGHYGIYAEYGCSNVNVTGNNLNGQYWKGIMGQYNAGSGILISNNTVVGDAAASASNYECISVPTVATVIGNVVSLSQGDAGILIAGGANCVVRNNTITAGGTTKSIRISSGSTGYVLTDNVMNVAITNSAAGAGNFGTATIASGTTSIAVTHNVGYTPDVASISITPTLLSNAAKWWISATTSTTFTISVDADPGASTATFKWRIST
jgi:parallel beta-helix repeat protein